MIKQLLLGLVLGLVFFGQTKASSIVESSMQLRDFLSIASIGNSIYLFANKQASRKESMDREAVIELSEKLIAGQIRIFDELVELKSRIPTIVREEFRKEIERGCD